MARHLNMRSAAIELNLTKGAVSYQIKQLESELGFELFSRSNRNLELTVDGKILLGESRKAFNVIEQTIDSLQRQTGNRITIGMATYFASRWLSPRLMRFITRFPTITLRIQPLVDQMNLANEDLDLMVRWGNGDWHEPGMIVDEIFQCPAMLTASADTGFEIEQFGLVAAIADQTLLHDRDDSSAWQRWAEAAGIQHRPDNRYLVIPDPNVRVQAVIDGQGIALYDVLVADEVSAGRLYQYDKVMLNDYGYYLVYPGRSANNFAINAFKDWILDEAGDV
ncbi:MAG: DNA-binding transcriptional LysR family regulator [Gammaproteobacteria bacterium]